jgi:hypothetical protein
MARCPHSAPSSSASAFHPEKREEQFSPGEVKLFPQSSGKPKLACESLANLPYYPQVRIIIRKHWRGLGSRGRKRSAVDFIPGLNWYNCSLPPAKSKSGSALLPADGELLRKVCESQVADSAAHRLLGSPSTLKWQRSLGPIIPDLGPQGNLNSGSKGLGEFLQTASGKTAGGTSLQPIC